MIAGKVVREIERLLRESKLSQRKVATLTGVSRATVSMIASGRRPDYEARELERELESVTPSGPPARCRECGGLVYGPCRLCRIRKAIAIQRDRLRFRSYWNRSLNGSRQAG